MTQSRSLLISENFPPGFGGSGRWFWELYRRLPSGSFSVAAGAQEGDADFDRTCELDISRVPLTFPTRFIRPASLPYYRRALREILALVRAQEIDSLRAGRCLPEGLLALLIHLRTGIPYSCFAHGEEVNLSNSEKTPGWSNRRVYESRELGMIVGLVLSRASQIVANSQNTRSILVDRWRLASDRVQVLHPGVDTTLFRPAARSTTERLALGWGERPVILTVGRLQKRKGHDLLIRALPDLCRDLPEILYAIAGSGEELDALRRLTVDKGLDDHVQFLTELDDQRLASCYQQCDLFVLPNRDLRGDIEGFGMVLLEAQACGRPVVAGSSGGTAETMSISDTGLLVDVEDHEALVTAISDLLSDPQRLDRMGSRARSWVVERFEWDVLAKQATALFEQLPPRNRPSSSSAGGRAAGGVL